jgi:hypothetical protein
MGRVFGSFAATQIDFGLFGNGELEWLEIGILVRTIAKWLIC